MREIAANYRYSISGFPCLYLGDSVDLCEKELGVKNCLVAKFTTNCAMKYYDFSSIELESDLEQEKIITVLNRMILVMAVSYHINSSSIKKDVKFVPYYILSQLITAAIAGKDNSIRCMRYKSTKASGSNYVFIPILKNIKSSVYDEDLRGKFKITVVK